MATLKAMLVASADLPMEGPAGEDQKVGGMQPAELPVEVDQAGGNAGQLPVPLEGLRRHLHRPVQGVGEGDEALGRTTGLRQGEKLLLGLLDLVARGQLGVGGGFGGDLSADADQIPPERQVIDGAGVVGA